MHRALKLFGVSMLALSTLNVAVPVGAVEPLQVMLPGRYTQMMARHSDTPFIVGFWSLDCPPCYRELAFWGEQRREGARMHLVLISTDTAGDAEEIGALLKHYGLQDVETWVFGAPAQQLRFEADRHWQGELPRTYLIDKGRVVDAVSGVIDAAQLRQWQEKMGSEMNSAAAK
ncbi:MAG: TlpA family protein disulfide reductase [Gammaproteobacteria bacterium]|nr:TlpA family protein disulfide reductase [Gammaproteobacteria bacterium]